MVAQAIKAIHQAAPDEGDWRIAWHLTTLRDPLHRTPFGHTEKELERIAVNSKAMEDLESRMRHEKGRDEHHRGDDDRETPKGRGKGKKGTEPKAPPP